MGILYKKRTLIGNISLVVFLAFLVTMTLGAFPGLSHAVTPTLDNSLSPQVSVSAPVKVIDKSNNWQDTTATVRTNSAGTQVTLTVQVLTQDNFENILLDLVGVGQVEARNVTSAIYKNVYGTVYSVYQLVYTWVYSQGLSVGDPEDYDFVVYSSGVPLASIILDLETPPPSGGGGGGGRGGSPTTTTTTTPTGTVTTKGSTSTLTADAAKVDAIISDPNKTTVELTVPAAANVTTAAVQVGVEQLAKVFEANKEAAVAFGDVKLTFAPGAIDLAAFAGQNATVMFEIKSVDPSQVSGTTGSSLFKVAGNVYELNIRVLVGNQDKGGIHSFSKPVEVKLPYDPSNLGTASEESLGVYRYNETTGAWDYVGGKVDTTANCVSVNLNSFSKYAVMAYQKTFADMAGHWAKADVEIMASRHIVTGMTGTTFGPELNVSRAQFATFLQRSLNLAADESAAGQFSDVQSGSWYAGAVGAAVKANLVKGYEDGTFRPDQLITRQEMAVMITRALAYSGKTVVLKAAEIEALLARFSDAAQVGDWAKEAAAVAVKESIVNGRTDNLYEPEANATRAEAVVMLKRMLKSTGAL